MQTISAGRDSIDRGLHLIFLLSDERRISYRQRAGPLEKMSLSATRRRPCQRLPLEQLSSCLRGGCPPHTLRPHPLQVPAIFSRCSACCQPSIAKAGAFRVLSYFQLRRGSTQSLRCSVKRILQRRPMKARDLQSHTASCCADGPRQCPSICHALLKAQALEAYESSTGGDAEHDV